MFNQKRERVKTNNPEYVSSAIYFLDHSHPPYCKYCGNKINDKNTTQIFEDRFLVGYSYQCNCEEAQKDIKIQQRSISIRNEADREIHSLKENANIKHLDEIKLQHKLIAKYGNLFKEFISAGQIFAPHQSFDISQKKWVDEYIKQCGVILMKTSEIDPLSISGICKNRSDGVINFSPSLIKYGKMVDKICRLGNKRPKIKASFRFMNSHTVYSPYANVSYLYFELEEVEKLYKKIK